MRLSALIERLEDLRDEYGGNLRVMVADSRLGEYEISLATRTRKPGHPGRVVLTGVVQGVAYGEGRTDSAGDPAGSQGDR